MKLPFDLGVKLFFRLVLPGFLLTLGLLPTLFELLDAVGLVSQKEVAFVLTTIVAGWLLLAADLPIYMLLEGRRYWPRFLWRWLLRCEEKRLGTLNYWIDEYYRRSSPNDKAIKQRYLKQNYLEASVGKRYFPLNKNNGERYAKYPTRLGNTLSAFETYSDTRYNLEGVFYWPRILVNLSKDLREEIDNQQAMSDSTVYSTFALAFTGVLWAFYGLLAALEGPVVAFLYRREILHEMLENSVFSYFPYFPVCFLFAGIFLLLSYFVYRLAIFTNEQFGNLFMAIIDNNISKIKEYIDVEGITKKVTQLAKIPADCGEDFDIVRRYLQYFNVKLPGLSRAVPFPQVENLVRENETGIDVEVIKKIVPHNPYKA